MASSEDSLVGAVGVQMVDVVVFGTSVRRVLQLNRDVVNAEIIGCDLPQAAPQEFQVLELGIDQAVGREHLVAGDEVQTWMSWIRPTPCTSSISLQSR